MAKLNAFGSPGVYAISFQDEKYNPGTKIVEGSTGQRYASNYMGARSRWWDISAKQAAYEAGQIEAANKAVRAEIAAIQKARTDLISDYAKRADTMARYNETAERDRLKWNAGIGPKVTTTTYDREGRPIVKKGPAEGSKRSYAIAKVVQEKLVKEEGGPAGKARAIEGLIRAGDLGADKYSQDMGAYYAIQMDAEILSNRLQAAEEDLSKEEADAAAEAQVLKDYDAVPQGKNLANRYRFVKAQGELEAGSGGPYDKTVTVESGKRALAERPVLYPDPIDEQLEALATREKEARDRIQDPIDLIDRTRQIQREKFGPSIIQSIRELPGGIRRLRQPEGLGRELRAIRRFLEDGGTMEELQSLLGPPTPVGPSVERDATVRGVRPGVGEVPGRFTPPGRFLEEDRFPPPVPPRPRTREEIEAAMPRVTPPEVRIGQPGMMETVSPRREAGMGLELGTRPGPGRPMTDEEIEAARRSILPRQEFYPGVPMGSEEQFRREEIEARMPQITPSPMTDEEIEDAKRRILPRQEFYPGVPMDMGDTELRSTPIPKELLEATSPATEEPSTGGGLRKPPGEKKEKPKQRKVKLFGVDVGSPEQVEHRGNLLQGFMGAASLLEKPKALDRKTANAESGSPQQFARAVIDAERAKSASERLPLKDLIANVAQQYNQMGDKAGRDSALENTIALYKLFLDEQSLLG